MLSAVGGDVQVCLVQGTGLHVGVVVPEDAARLVADLHVLLEVCSGAAHTFDAVDSCDSDIVHASPWCSRSGANAGT